MRRRLDQAALQGIEAIREEPIAPPPVEQELPERAPAPQPRAQKLPAR
ncbi:MAG: hypothetical protein IPN17_06130 [Deltaproteobacteria bacterium]|nr:hypothetical protein [Deltaproteobacteria bacterium]